MRTLRFVGEWVAPVVVAGVTIGWLNSKFNEWDRLNRQFDLETAPNS